MFDLKTLSPEAVPRALAKAERYRLLNEPGEAQSICLDVLGGLYLAYDLLGGQNGPLRLLTRMVTYSIVFGAGYGLGLGFFFGLASGAATGLTLAIELQRAAQRNKERRERSRTASRHGCPPALSRPTK